MTDAALRLAVAKGVNTVFLLTTTAERFFPKFGFEQISRIYFAAGARSVHLGIPGIGPLEKMSEVEKITRRTDMPFDELAQYASHPMGTARMHADMKLGVVKPDGETHEVKNLIVADASLFPTSLGVNPQLTTMAMATVIGRSMVDDWGL